MVTGGGIYSKHFYVKCAYIRGNIYRKGVTVRHGAGKREMIHRVDLSKDRVHYQAGHKKGEPENKGITRGQKQNKNR